MWFPDLYIKEIDIHNFSEVQRVEEFLKTVSLKLEKDIQFLITLENGEKIIGTGAFSGKVIKNIAMHPKFQSYGLASRIVSEVIKEQVKRKIDHFFVYTKPQMSQYFLSLGFNLLANVEPYVALLEMGSKSIAGYLDDINKYAKAHFNGRNSAIVVNCNPFTLGHQYLIEIAAKDSDYVYVIVVSEDRSLFPVNIRLLLVKEGTKHLKNVQVIEGGYYIVSSATFPSYFTRDENFVKTQALLDVEMFCRYYAPTLHINHRYVGDEPYCIVTNEYNSVMEEELPRKGIAYKKIPRKKVMGEMISASIVREKIRVDDWEGVRRLVPPTTYQFLISPQCKSIIKEIKANTSRH